MAIRAATARMTACARLRHIEKVTVWHEFTGLAKEMSAVNLGQGFPDSPPAQFLMEGMAAMAADLTPNAQQYAPTAGHPRLVAAIAERFTRRLGREVSGATDVVVTVGATEALYLCAHAFLEPDDEVVMFEPFFDVYPRDVWLAGGRPVFVPLTPPPPGAEASGDAWHLDMDALRAAITPRSKMLCVNTPQNVPGKVWRREELLAILEVAEQHDLILVVDEVYDHLLFDGHRHVHAAALPGAWRRVLTVGSAGKYLGSTGLKVGWAVGPAELVEPLRLVHSQVSFSAPTQMQVAVAYALEKAAASGGAFDAAVLADYDAKRQRLCALLRRCGLRPHVPSGAFFVVAEIGGVPGAVFGWDDAAGKPAADANPKVVASVGGPAGLSRDWVFCRWLTVVAGVAAIPMTAFYSPPHAALATNYVRFAACKTAAAYDAADERLFAALAPARAAADAASRA